MSILTMHVVAAEIDRSGMYLTGFRRYLSLRRCKEWKHKKGLAFGDGAGKSTVPEKKLVHKRLYEKP